MVGLSSLDFVVISKYTLFHDMWGKNHALFFIGRGFSNIGNFLGWNPAATSAVGLPLKGWHIPLLWICYHRAVCLSIFCREGQSWRAERPIGLGHSGVGTVLGNRFPASVGCKDIDFRLPPWPHRPSVQGLSSLEPLCDPSKISHFTFPLCILPWQNFGAR